MLTGWVFVERGENEAGLAQLQHGIATTVAVGGHVGRAMQRLFLAQGYARAGQVTAGLAAVADALAWIESTNVRLLEAEMYRMRGELLLAHVPRQNEPPGCEWTAAADCFRPAIDLARRQPARWWELRATVSLCRLLRATAGSHKERAHARQRLAEVVGWCSEGFETRDLQEARQLLAEFN